MLDCPVHRRGGYAFVRGEELIDASREDMEAYLWAADGVNKTMRAITRPECGCGWRDEEFVVAIAAARINTPVGDVINLGPLSHAALRWAFRKPHLIITPWDDVLAPLGVACKHRYVNREDFSDNERRDGLIQRVVVWFQSDEFPEMPADGWVLRYGPDQNFPEWLVATLRDDMALAMRRHERGALLSNIGEILNDASDPRADIDHALAGLEANIRAYLGKKGPPNE